MLKYQGFIYELATREYNDRQQFLLERAEAESAGRLSSFEPSRPRFKPVRQPSTSGTSNTGQFLSYKAGGLVPYDSILERDFYKVMEWDYGIESFKVQPVKIPYRKVDGRHGEYVPDVLVYQDKLFRKDWPSFCPTVYEIKPRAVLKEEWDEVKPKLRAGRDFCRKAGFRFRLLTDAELNHDYLANISFLLRFRGPRFVQRSRTEAAIVKSLMDEMLCGDEFFTPNSLLDRVEGRVAPRMRVIPWMWHLYSDYIIQCDMLTPMSMDTISWRCGDGGRGGPSRPDWRRIENDWRR